MSNCVGNKPVAQHVFHSIPVWYSGLIAQSPRSTAEDCTLKDISYRATGKHCPPDTWRLITFRSVSDAGFRKTGDQSL